MSTSSLFRLIAIATFLLPTTARADWPMLAHDVTRSGATSDEIRPPFARKWVRAFPDEGVMAGVQPVTAGGRLFIGTLHGKFHAIDTNTGKDVWTFDAGGAILHAAAIAADRVFFGAADGKLYALNIADGKPAWTLQTGAAIWNSPLVYNGVVYFGSRDGKLYAADAATGQLKWSAATSGPILNSPAIDPKTNRLYVGSDDMHVYAFDAATGKQIWQSPKLPGISFRGYHPVISPDGSVMVTVTPMISSDTIQLLLQDMSKAIFGNYSTWRNKNGGENPKVRDENFELMKKPETYQKQLDYLRKRLTDEPAYQTFFVLDQESRKPKFVTPLVYGESMNGPGSPAVVTPDGKVIVKYSALLRSRYQHYSPWLNVGYLDTVTGHITPIMDQSRTYGWYDSLLLVHDEQCQLVVGGKVLINTHQDNVNAMDLTTLKGWEQPWAHNVHEVKNGVAASIWAEYLQGKPLSMGWEWFARGSAVYGGGSVIDVPVVVDGDSFYFLPTHEINSGVTLLAYKMDPRGDAGKKAPEPTEKLTADDWNAILKHKWDWDVLTAERLKHLLVGLPTKMPGTRQYPARQQGEAAAAKITDAQLDEVIWHVAPRPTSDPDTQLATSNRSRLVAAVDELISTQWQPLRFPSGKTPDEAHRFFVDPTETLYTLALAYPHLPAELQQKVKAHVTKLSAEGGALAGPVGQKSYDPHAGELRSAYDLAPESLQKLGNDMVRSDTARLYPLWYWAVTTGDWDHLKSQWAAIKPFVRGESEKGESDCGNARIAGLIAACRIARQLADQPAVDQFLPLARAALRQRLDYEFTYTEGGLMTYMPTPGTIFGRWHFLTPDVAYFLRTFASDTHRHLMDVYVDYHRPSWWMAWNVELMWKNETNLLLPTVPMEIFSAKALILGEKSDRLNSFVDLPWCKADEYYIQKLSLVLENALSPQ